MEKINILQSVSDAITEESFSFDITLSPENELDRRLQRWKLRPEKRSFQISPLKIGSAMRISKLMLDVEFKGAIDISSMTETIYGSGEKMAEVIAIAITNRKGRPSRSLVNLLKWNLTSSELKTLTSAVVKSINIESFLTTIILMKGVNVLELGETKPKEMSPSVPGNTSEEL